MKCPHGCSAEVEPAENGYYRCGACMRAITVQQLVDDAYARGFGAAAKAGPAKRTWVEGVWPAIMLLSAAQPSQGEGATEERNRVAVFLQSTAKLADNMGVPVHEYPRVEKITATVGFTNKLEAEEPKP